MTAMLTAYLQDSCANEGCQGMPVSRSEILKMVREATKELRKLAQAAFNAGEPLEEWMIIYLDYPGREVKDG